MIKFKGANEKTFGDQQTIDTAYDADLYEAKDRSQWI